MALSIAKPKHRSLTNPSLVHLFSSSPYQNAPNSPSQSPSEDHQQQKTSPSSYFTELKATMKQRPQNQPNNSSFPHLTTPVNLNPPISKSAGDLSSLADISQKLREFRARSVAPSPVDSNAAGPPYSGQQNQQPTTSFQELYKRHTNVKPEDRSVSSQSSPNSTGMDFATIRNSIRQLAPKTVQPKTDNRSVDISGLAKGQLKSTVIGGTQELPLPMLAKEQNSGKDYMSIEFVKMYSMDELGDKMRSLRPEMKEKGWFSFEELAERLRKLRTMEVEEIKNSTHGLPIQQLRESLSNIQGSNVKKNAVHERIEVLSKLGDPDCMAYPPQEHLVEQYFHPDNMSSAEKLKLDLSKVREEFKMSESDCGSARVQVAQLTTKIKHLSSVLHKKDKHSRKGLQEMVQRRKKLLKYLRRTDWDSYCFVLSKLGLRDNADTIKH